MVVGADRAGPVAQVGLQPHQGAVADLLQRLQLDPAARGLHRPGQVAVPRPRLARAGRTGPRTGARALTWPRAASRRTRRAAGRPGTRRWPAAACASDPLVVAGRGRRQGRLALDVEDAQVDAAASRCRASTGPWASRPATARRPAPGAGDAARGAGWSAPARRSTPARTARRSAAGAGATRRARPGRRPGQPRATSGSGRRSPSSVMACSPRSDTCSMSTCPPGPKPKLPSAVSPRIGKVPRHISGATARRRGPSVPWPRRPATLSGPAFVQPGPGT